MPTTQPHKTSLPWMPWYPSDFLSSSRVQRMTLAEQGAYRRLLDYQWMDGAIPADMGEIARLLGVARDEAESLWLRVGQCFDRTADGHANPRLAAMRIEQIASHNERVASGQKGAMSRWAKDGSANGSAMRELIANGCVANGNQNQSQNQNQMQSESKHQRKDSGASPRAVKLPPPGRDDLIRFFGEEYQRTQSAPYVGVKGRDNGCASRLLRSFSLDEAKSRITRFLQVDDDWLNRTDRNFAIFAQQVNRPSVRGIEVPEKNGHRKSDRVGYAAPSSIEEFKNGRVSI